MGPGFESQRDHQMGQVDKRIACPIFFLSKSLVQAVYQLDRLVQSGGSKNFSLKSQFFWKNRTDYLTFLYSCSCMVDFVQVEEVVDGFI